MEEIKTNKELTKAEEEAKSRVDQYLQYDKRARLDFILYCFKNPDSYFPTELFKSIFKHIDKEKHNWLSVYQKFFECIVLPNDNGDPDCFYDGIKTKVNKNDSKCFWNSVQNLVGETVCKEPNRIDFIRMCIKEPSSELSSWYFGLIKRFAEKEGEGAYKKFLECAVPSENQDGLFKELSKSKSEFSSKDDKESSVAFWTRVKELVYNAIYNIKDKASLVKNCVEDPYSDKSLLVIDAIEGIIEKEVINTPKEEFLNRKQEKAIEIYRRFFSSSLPFDISDSFLKALYKGFHTEEGAPKLASTNFWELLRSLVGEAIHKTSIEHKRKLIYKCIKNPSSDRSFWFFAAIQEFVWGEKKGSYEELLGCVISPEHVCFYKILEALTESDGKFSEKEACGFWKLVGMCTKFVDEENKKEIEKNSAHRISGYSKQNTSNKYNSKEKLGIIEEEKDEIKEEPK